VKRSLGGVSGVVLDIEGTTTPLSFVHDVLFPYARAHLREFLDAHLDRPSLEEATRLLRAEWGEDACAGHEPPALRDGTLGARRESLARYAEWLMDRDRKSPGLKLLQGLIWQEGYEAGTLHGEVFPDVPPAFDRWHAKGLAIAIYSSGSVLAQQLIFRTTRFGDLTAHIASYFDTAVGAKREAESYRRIATAMGAQPGTLLFVSDVVAELNAARASNLRTLLCIRPGNPPEMPGEHASIRSFDELEV
jgi:enolase-phosphatase E1